MTFRPHPQGKKPTTKHAQEPNRCQDRPRVRKENRSWKAITPEQNPTPRKNRPWNRSEPPRLLQKSGGPAHSARSRIPPAFAHRPARQRQHRGQPPPRSSGVESGHPTDGGWSMRRLDTRTLTSGLSPSQDTGSLSLFGPPSFDPAVPVRLFARVLSSSSSPSPQFPVSACGPTIIPPSPPPPLPPAQPGDPQTPPPPPPPPNRKPIAPRPSLSSV